MDNTYISDLISCIKSRYPDLILMLTDRGLCITDSQTNQKVEIPLPEQDKNGAACDPALIQKWLITIIDLVSLNLTAIGQRNAIGNLMIGYIQAVSRVDNPLNNALSIDGEGLRHNYGWYQDGMLVANPFLSLHDKLKGQSHNRKKAIQAAKKRLVRDNYPLRFIDPGTGLALPHYMLRLSGIRRADHDGAEDFLGKSTCNILIGEVLFCVLLNRYLTHKNLLGSLDLMRKVCSDKALDEALDTYLNACYEVHMSMLYKSLISSNNRYVEVAERLLPRLLTMNHESNPREPFYTYQTEKSDTICCKRFLDSFGDTLPAADGRCGYLVFFGEEDSGRKEPSHVELITRFHDFRCKGDRGDYLEFTSIGVHREDAYPVRYRVLYGKCIPAGQSSKADTQRRWHIRNIMDFTGRPESPQLKSKISAWRNPDNPAAAYSLSILRILRVDAEMLDGILGYR